MTLTQLAFWMFAAIAAGGVTIAALIVFKVRFPAFLGMGHGLGGLTSLAVLFIANLRGETHTSALAWWALGVFLAGMIGGMLFFRVLFKNAPLMLVAMHGSLGAVGLFLLYRAAF